MSQATLVGDRELAISRLLGAPRELAWSLADPKHIGAWWGPNGFRTTTEAIELRPGQWRFVMHGPDGRDYRNRIVYREVVQPERLVYEHAREDGEEPVRCLQPRLPTPAASGCVLDPGAGARVGRERPPSRPVRTRQLPIRVR